MDTTIERRYCSNELLTERNDAGKFERVGGYAAVFNSMSEELWGFREKIEPGAFSDTIRTDDVRALFNHDPNFVLGRNRAKTLWLREDEKGLRYSAKAPDTEWARDLMVSIDRGDITQSSFGFQVITDKWETIEEENVRTLVKVRLFDVSPVTFPAYPESESWVRSLNEQMGALQIGFDYPRVMRALIRAERDMPFINDDREIIDEFVRLLESKRQPMPMPVMERESEVALRKIYLSMKNPNRRNQ